MSSQKTPVETIETNQGTARAITFDDGRIGWQLSDRGLLLGLIFPSGQIGEPLSDGIHRWTVLSHATPAHRDLLQLAVDRSEFDFYPLKAKGFKLTPVKGL